MIEKIGIWEPLSIGIKSPCVAAILITKIKMSVGIQSLPRGTNVTFVQNWFNPGIPLNCEEKKSRFIEEACNHKCHQMWDKYLIDYQIFF